MILDAVVQEAQLVLPKNVELDKVLPVERLLLGPLEHLGRRHVHLSQRSHRRRHGVSSLELGRNGS